MKKISLVVLLMLLSLVLVSCTKTSTTHIMIYAGVGLKGPLDEITEMYTNKTGVKFDVIYAGSGTLLAQIQSTQKGDIFIPGGMSHYQKAVEEGLILKGVKFAYHVPTIIVKKGNPKNIMGLLDLRKSGLKLALGDESSLPIGIVSKKMLEKANIYNEVKKNVVVWEGSVSKLVLDVDKTDIDASIVWETLGAQFGENIQEIPIEKQYLVIEAVPISILKTTVDKSASEKFMNFVLSDEGLKVFEKYGYRIIKQ
ncbi:molybdate ABC transporter substrate-binding protein [Caldisericum exile]|uniref:Molybdate ABC transporter substrate-binding protein n=1 Tax=Caldisericum exile (strain DSM 21853 / NBRC 104410 / AZM16c01) TaxID=511051 RepID=A0A7U6GDV3_CALEA|nr:molybdate ABC transporter substrate-binding protein [Caldisericum exile]BAL80574.1 putative molybdate ABC transporter substrate-binding protein [Caldisericum exile AZM16c01]